MLNYVVVYFLGLLIIIGSTAAGRTGGGAWLVGYRSRYCFIPRLGKVSERRPTRAR